MSNTRKPDILECLSNLSNDEVFTTPVLANQILDTLPKELWGNKNATFLDPFTKSGVFLREITKRLLKGLVNEFPSLQERIDHILKNQVFGIATTELTSLVARRSLYCSKKANSEKAITDIFQDEQGNIIYKKLNHEWKKGKCKFCGANRQQYERSESLEQHTYPFIHIENPLELFKNMKFDVIVGNPPYQLNDGGGTGSAATPLYNFFVEQAKKMNASFLIMIIPSRWFTGGRGVDEFRKNMLNDKRLKVINDFPNASDCFPGVEIKGGVCYFLWEKEYNGKCQVNTFKGNEVISTSIRNLLEKGADTFIRYNDAISILDKVKKHKEESFSKIISSNDPFGFDVRETNSFTRVKPSFKKAEFKNSTAVYYYGWQRDGLGYIDKEKIKKNNSLIEGYKVFISKAYGAGETYPHQIINEPIIGNPNSCCTESYLIMPFANLKRTKNAITYIKTRFFRFMVLLIKNTQNAMKKVYQFVPMQNFDEEWTDEKLYKKYDLTTEEIAFIESMVRPMQ